MNEKSPDERLATLRDYSAGRLGTRQAIEHLGFHDYADLIIALAGADLAFPKPADTPQRMAHLARAKAVLEPRLRHGN